MPKARIVGTRGMGIDWTEFDDHAGRVAASLRRGEVLDHILWRMGQEVLAPRMMQAALDALMNALGAEGAAVIDVQRRRQAHCWCIAPAAARTKSWPRQPHCLPAASGPTGATAKDGRPILVAICHTRFGANAGIALWRSPGSRGWDQRGQAADRLPPPA